MATVRFFDCVYLEGDFLILIRGWYCDILWLRGYEGMILWRMILLWPGVLLVLSNWKVALRVGQSHFCSPCLSGWISVVGKHKGTGSTRNWSVSSITTICCPSPYRCLSELIMMSHNRASLSVIHQHWPYMIWPRSMIGSVYLASNWLTTRVFTNHSRPSRLTMFDRPSTIISHHELINHVVDDQSKLTTRMTTNWYHDQINFSRK